jgi:hypothetical protein
MNFDTVLNNKESVDYVIQIYQKLILILNYLLRTTTKFKNNLIINLLPYNMSQSSKKYIDRSHENIQMDVVQKLSITLGLIGLFIMVLYSTYHFPIKRCGLQDHLAVLTGIIIYANRTYLNQPEGIKQRCWHQSLTSKGAWMIGIVLTAFYIAFILVSQYLGLNQSGGLNTVSCTKTPKTPTTLSR